MEQPLAHFLASLYSSGEMFNSLRVRLPCALSCLLPARSLSATSVCAARERFIPGKTRGVTVSELRGPTIDESDYASINIDALAQDMKQGDALERPFERHPTGDMAEREFYGVKYKDMPYVQVLCAPNSTRFWLRDINHRKLLYVTPVRLGFLNAKRRSNVAAQAAGLSLGQQIRNLNIKAVRVKIDGFNNGRVAGLKGILQAGIHIVSVTDNSYVDWGWRKRAKKPKRRN